MAAIERLLHALLRALPETTRKRYGDAIVQTILERVSHADGKLAASAFLIRECLGIVVSGARARRERARQSRKVARTRRAPFFAGRAMDFCREVRIASRSLWRRPWFSLPAILALALGVAAAVAIFSVFHAILLRPLPFAEPDRLVSIWEKNPEQGWHKAQVASANYLDWRSEASTFADMAAHNDWLDQRVLLEGGEPVIVLASEVTGNFFDVLGVPPLLGRPFDDAHSWAGLEPVVVLSWGFWSRHYGEDPTVIGRAIDLDGVAHRVLGVMPRTFGYPFRDADLWVPVAWDPALLDQARFRRAHGLRVVGRLARGVTLREAESELAAIAARLELDYPETNEEMGNGVTPLHEWVTGDASRPLQILMVAVAFLLLIACANVSNMLLARASSRQNELHLRSALGGARTRLLFEGLLEGALLAGLGGAVGLWLGLSAIRPLLKMSPGGLPRIQEIGVDATAVLFAAAITLVCAVLISAVPAWRGANAGSLSVTRANTAARSSRRMSALLVAAEVALTLPLVVGAGLMARTLGHLSAVEPGFDTRKLLVASVALPTTRYPSADSMTRFYRELWQDLGTIPGVEAAAMSSRLPFGNQRWSSHFTAEGWPADRYGVGVRRDEITPGLFQTMRVPLLRGRDFSAADNLQATPVVIVNEALADRYFPGEDPLGKRIVFDQTPDATSVWRTIVGIVGNVRRETLALQEKPSFYAPVFQDTTGQLHLLVRTEQDPNAIVAAVRDRVRALDPSLPLFDVTTLETVVATSVARERFLLVLLSIAAVVALVLTSIGIFGVVLYSTTRRVREIGIRVALGARSASVSALILRSGLEPVLLGIVVGGFAAFLLARAMSSLLFGVQPFDLRTFGSVIAIVLVVAALACALPARWATRVDPTSALRAD